MPTVHPFHVVPSLPESLSRLRTLAFNLHWAWDHETIELFRRLDRQLWEQSGHNPVKMLGTIDQEQLRDAALDEAFVSELGRVHYGLETYLRAANTWFSRHYGESVPKETRIAYFSMEFGLTECLPTYSGGLGVLSGDHLKSSSDLGLPLVGIGLLYQQGYFRQQLNADCRQQERYADNDFYNLPIEAERDAEGKLLRIQVEFPGRNVIAQVWKVRVGRIPLYLLDTNIDVNSSEDQAITDTLYGGDNENRLKQEMVLGIGGMRALAALGIKPTVCHMNEGHSAFLSLERTRQLMLEAKTNFWHAREAAAAGNLFTTHTPVPAGFDVFPPDLLGRYFETYINELGISFDDFMKLGKHENYDTGGKFNMAILAMRFAHHANGVSKLHGKVSRKMTQVAYPGFREDEVPVSHITNGIHTRSFISQEMADLLDRYLGGRWSRDVSDTGVWAKVDDIPDEEIWRIRERRRERLVLFARQRVRSQYEQRGVGEEEIRQVRDILSPGALTLGFARRFATYKRATLLLSDPERLIRLLNDPQRPVQFLIAGKAHPKDEGGKDLIQEIAQFARKPEVRQRMVFLEDYDMNVARHLVQGVDIWLNTPRRPMEASGTSGMKLLANGGLNVSIPDGWWAEGYNPTVGWSIGRGEDYPSPEEQDRVEAHILYDILEKGVVPLFYDRSIEGIPRAWISRIKSSMRQLCPVFNTHRMVSEYATRYYFPAAARFTTLSADSLKRASVLADWKDRMRVQWSRVRVEGVETQQFDADDNVTVGATVHLAAKIRLGELTPDDVQVQAVYGALDSNHQVTGGTAIALSYISGVEEIYRYEGEIPCQTSGLQGFSVRVLPYHPDAELPQELPLIAWE